METPTPTPTFVAVLIPEATLPCVAGIGDGVLEIKDLIAEDGVVKDDEVGVPEVLDIWGVLLLDDEREAENKELVGINDGVVEVNEGVEETACAALATVGTSLCHELRATPGVEQPTPPPLPETGSCVKQVQSWRQQNPIPADSQFCQEASAHYTRWRQKVMSKLVSGMALELTCAAFITSL